MNVYVCERCGAVTRDERCQCRHILNDEAAAMFADARRPPSDPNPCGKISHTFDGFEIGPCDGARGHDGNHGFARKSKLSGQGPYRVEWEQGWTAANVRGSALPHAITFASFIRDGRPCRDLAEVYELVGYLDAKAAKADGLTAQLARSLEEETLRSKKALARADESDLLMILYRERSERAGAHLDQLNARIRDLEREKMDLAGEGPPKGPLNLGPATHRYSISWVAADGTETPAPLSACVPRFRWTKGDGSPAGEASRAAEEWLEKQRAAKAAASTSIRPGLADVIEPRHARIAAAILVAAMAFAAGALSVMMLAGGR